jgi:hypothetical protein
VRNTLASSRVTSSEFLRHSFFDKCRPCVTSFRYLYRQVLLRYSKKKSTLETVRIVRIVRIPCP